MEETTLSANGSNFQPIHSLANHFCVQLNKIRVFQGNDYLEMLSKAMLKASKMMRSEESYEDTVKSSFVHAVREQMIKKKSVDYFKCNRNDPKLTSTQAKLSEYIMVLESYLRYCTTKFLCSYNMQDQANEDSLVQSLLRDYRIDVTSLSVYPVMFVAMFNGHSLDQVSAYRPNIVRGQGVYYNLIASVLRYYEQIEGLMLSQVEYQVRWCCFKQMDLKTKQQLGLIDQVRKAHLKLLKTEQNQFNELEGKINECISEMNDDVRERNKEIVFNENTPLTSSVV